jgi:hypothetical protein
MATISTDPAATTHPHPFAVLTAMSAAMLALALAWSLADPRLVDGVPVWAKPAKFALSLCVHFGTLALVVTRLGPAARDGRLVAITAGIMATAFLAEMAYITVQAAQAEPSHFNVATPFHGAMYALMGLGAVLLVLGPVAVAWAARHDPAARLGPATRQGLWLGALVSFGLTLVTAGTLSALAGHHVGTPGPDAAVLPLFGWSAEVGDLRPAHFLALHALQVLPLAGLALDRAGRGGGPLGWVALGYGALTLAVFAQALMGLPLLRL